MKKVPRTIGACLTAGSTGLIERIRGGVLAVCHDSVSGRIDPGRTAHVDVI